MLVLRRVFGLLLMLNFFSFGLASLLGSHINSYMRVSEGNHIVQLLVAFGFLLVWLVATAYQGLRELQGKPLGYAYMSIVLALYFIAIMPLFGSIPRIDFSSNELAAYLTAYVFWVVPIVQFFDLFVVAPHHEPELGLYGSVPAE